MSELAKADAPRRSRAARFNLASQGLGLLLSVATGFLLAPLVLRSVEPSLYGAWMATGNVLAWLAMVDPGTQAVLRQRAAEAFGRGDKRGMESAIGTGLAVNTVFSLLFVALSLLASLFVPGLVNLSGPAAAQLAFAFALAAVAEGTLMLALGLSSVLLALMWSTGWLGAAYLVATAAGFAASVGLLLGGHGLWAVPAGLLVRALLLLLAHAALLWEGLRAHHLRPTLGRDELRAVLQLSSATWLSKLGSSALRGLDGLTVARWVEPAAVARLTLSRRPMDVIGQLVARAGSAFSPTVAYLAGERSPELPRLVLRLLRLVLAASALGLCGYVALGEQFVRLWVGQALFSGAAALWVYAALGVWLGVQALLSELSYSAGRIEAVSRLVVFEAILATAGMALGAVAGAGLLAPGLGGLLAAAVAFTFGWRQVWREALQLGDAEVRAVTACAVRLLGLGALGGGLLRALLPPAGSWWTFAAEALAVVALLSPLLLLAEPALRPEAAGLLKTLSRRGKAAT